MNSIFTKLLLLLSMFFSSFLFADSADVDIHISDVSVNESEAEMTFTITVDELPLSLLSSVGISFETQDGTATAGNDYEAKKSNLLTAIYFTPYSPSTSKTVTIDLNDDNIYEGNEEFYLQISTSSNGYSIVGTGRAEGKILDDEPEPLSISVYDQSLYETDDNDSSVQFTAELTENAPAGGVTFSYATSNASTDYAALAGVDYVAKTGTVTIPEGERTALIEVDIIGDVVYEEPTWENFMLSITSSPTAVIKKEIANCWIGDNDPNGFPYVGFDQTNFSIVEGDSGQKSLTFTLSLDKPAIAGSSLHYETWDETAEDAAKDNDYIWTSGDINLTLGQQTVSIDVPINGDTQIESNETFNFGISNLNNLNITGSSRVTGTIVTDDGSYPKISFDQSSYTVTEGDYGQKELNITLSLDKPALANTSFRYETLDNTAKWSDLDYDRLFTTHNIPEGATKVSLQLFIQGDSKVESDEDLVLIIDAPSENLTFEASATAIQTLITLTNDDVDNRFACTTDAYVFGSTSYNTQTDSYGFDLSNGNQISSQLNINPANINAIGYNVKDNYIWGFDRGTYQVVRVDKNYAITRYDIAGLPTFDPSDDITPTYHIGDVSLDGIFHLATSADPTTVYRVNVDPSSSNYLTALSPLPLTQPIHIADFAFSPTDNMLYAINLEEELIRINPTSGQVTNLGLLNMPNDGNVVSVFFDNEGYLYAHLTSVSLGVTHSDNVYKIMPPANAQANIAATYFSNIGATQHGDGARCPHAPMTAKDDDPFTCDESMYISSSVNRQNPIASDKMWIHKIDTTINPFDFMVIDQNGSNRMYNALAYSDNDNYIYGLYKKELLQISKTGNVLSLGTLNALPDILSTKQLFAGAIYGNEYYVSGPGQDYDKIYTINLLDQNISEISLDTAISLLDFSFTPDGKYLHGIVDGGRLVKIDIAATNISPRKVTFVGTAHTGYQFDSTFSDINGRFFANDSQGNGFFEFDLTTGEKKFMSASQEADFNDGANCLSASLSFTDFGDAPLTYGSTSHKIANNIYLGSRVDHDIEDFNSLDADGDDLSGVQDDDGIKHSDGTDINGSSFPINKTHELQVTLSKEAYLKIWIDTDINAQFDDATDLVYNTNSTLSAGTHTISFSLPDGLKLNETTYLRARVSSDANFNANGHLLDGEVEDYAIKFAPSFQGVKGDFNIQRTNSILNAKDFALYTQIVGRDFNYHIVFYEEDFSLEKELSNVPVKIDLVDNITGDFLHTNYAYFSPTSPSTRVPMPDKHDLENLPATKEALFLITYATNSDGTVKQEECTSTTAKECFDTLMSIADGNQTTKAKDIFAIRPERFHISLKDKNVERVNSDYPIPSISLASGYEYNLSIIATEYNKQTASKGYDSIFTESFDFNTTGLSSCRNTSAIEEKITFTDGLHNNPMFSNDEAGKYTLTVSTDNTWTNIDRTNNDCIPNSSQTSADANSKPGCNISLAIAPIDLNFYPDHFDVDLIMQNLPNSTHDDFIYMSELNTTYNEVALGFRGKITAQNEKNATTENFTDGCMATNIILDLNASSVSVEGTNAQIHSVAGTDINFTRYVQFNQETTTVTNDLNQRLTRINNVLPIDRNKFLNENNGTLTLDMRYNLNKHLSEPINPVEVTFTDIKVTDINTQLAAHTLNNHLSRGEQTFTDNTKNLYFARVVSDLDDYPEININISPVVITPLNVDIYCKTTVINYCEDRGILKNTNLSTTTREQNGWYLSSNHNAEVDGNVTNLIDTPNHLTLTPSAGITLPEGKRGSNITKFDNCTASSVLVTIITDPVLRFSPSEYVVNCTDQDPSQWAGIGRAGNVLRATPKVDKAGKMDW